MNTLVEFESISKSFGGTVALDGVSLTVNEGECHALMGENGAGKSTLGKVLAGIHVPDAGTLRVAGTRRRFASPRDALMAGVGMVHQELAFCPDLSVGENLSLGHYPTRWGVLVDRSRMFTRARDTLREIAPEIDPGTRMGSLSVAQQQLVQIAGAIGTGARIIVFDEPTSSLSKAESDRLFGELERLRSLGVTMIFVSHRLAEVFRICDRITVLRDGRCIGTVSRTEATPDSIIGMMIGRKIEEYFPHHLRNDPGSELLRVQGLSSAGRFQDVSFTVRAGEILGFAGLVGSGRSEVAQAVFGLDPNASGTVLLDGNDLSRAPLRSRMDAGLALVPEDRKRHGLALLLSSRINFSLPLLDRIRRYVFLSRGKEKSILDTQFQKLNIKASSYDSPVAGLSGGNQQKVVLGKWLARDARVLLLDEPTRGVDVGAKAAIHALIDGLAAQGRGIVLISSELPEVLNLSTRILVMRAGRIVRDLARAEANQERLMRLMTGLES